MIALNIVMSGLDYERAPILLRERLSFTRSRVGELDCRLCATVAGLRGCVLLSTCNRTELYFSCEDGAQANPAELLCASVGAREDRQVFITRRGEDAARHLMAVAGGLKSQIWGDDQIISQVKEAVSIARENRAADPVLETLFREAASAGKEIKTKVRLTKTPASAASRAVELLKEASGGLSGQRALVIGNGEMGRLAAALLHEAGCTVTVTLRTYRHGETRVPAGCGVVPYEERYPAVGEADLLLSATTSPHYTISAAELRRCRHIPRLMVDLAIPRDIEPAVGELPGIRLFNMDDLGCAGDRTVPMTAEEIIDRHLERFRQWAGYRKSLPVLEEIKQGITRRILLTDDYTGLDAAGLVELSVSRAVDLLSGGLKEGVTEESLKRCARLIKTHTKAGGGA